MAIDKQYFQNYILNDIFPRYFEEISWFANTDLRLATPEKANAFSEESWTDFLQSHEKISPCDGKKYIELERMLASLVFYQLFKIGDQDAYQFFYYHQRINQHIAPDNYLSFESFQEIHDTIHTLLKNNPHLDKSIETMLVYSNLGKTRELDLKIKECIPQHNLPEDHDDLIEYLLQDQDKLSLIIPSAKSLNSDMRIIISRLATTMKVHWEHLKHWEGSMEQMLGKFILAAREKKVNREDILTTFIIQLCDVANSAAHGMMYTSALTEDSFQFYHQKSLPLLLKILDSQGEHGELHFQDYLQDITASFDLSLEIPNEYLAARLSTMLRMTKREEAQAILNALNALDPFYQELLNEQLGQNGEINKWQRNPSYFNSVMLNLAGSGKTLQEKAKWIVHGAICEAMIAQKVSQHFLNNATPCCFVELANAAIVEPDNFLIENFNIADWSCDGGTLKKTYAIVFFTSSAGDTDLAIATVRKMKQETFSSPLLMVPLTQIAWDRMKNLQDNTLQIMPLTTIIGHKDVFPKEQITNEDLQQIDFFISEHKIQRAFVGVPSPIKEEIPYQIAANLKIPCTIGMEFMFQPDKSHSFWKYLPRLTAKDRCDFTVPSPGAITDISLDNKVSTYPIGHLSIDRAAINPPKEKIQAIREELVIANDNELVFVSGTTQPMEIDISFLDALLAELSTGRYPQIQLRFGVHPNTENMYNYIKTLLNICEKYSTVSNQIKILLPQAIQEKIKVNYASLYMSADVEKGNQLCQEEITQRLREITQHPNVFLCEISGSDAAQAADKVAQAVAGALLNESAFKGKPSYYQPGIKSYLPNMWFSKNIPEFLHAKPQEPHTKEELQLKETDASTLLAGLMRRRN